MSYDVKRGDTLYAIARRLRPEGVTLNQVLVALFRANPDAFTGGNINQLRVGAVLAIPPRDAMAELPPAEAMLEVRTLTALKPPPAAAEPRPVTPPVAAVPAPGAAQKRPGKGLLGRDEAERRYKDGLAAERRGDEVGAFNAYLEAGESGHGLAQRKLGEIYDKGTAAVQRDYATALRWYQLAREQGVAVPRAETRGPSIR
ncbi:MAG: FimV/HubP family polar landmark protein [Betaproteobacteria bacterium]